MPTPQDSQTVLEKIAVYRQTLVDNAPHSQLVEIQKWLTSFGVPTITTSEDSAESLRDKLSGRLRDLELAVKLRLEAQITGADLDAVSALFRGEELAVSQVAQAIDTAEAAITSQGGDPYDPQTILVQPEASQAIVEAVRAVVVINPLVNQNDALADALTDDLLLQVGAATVERITESYKAAGQDAPSSMKSLVADTEILEGLRNALHSDVQQLALQINQTGVPTS